MAAEGSTNTSHQYRYDRCHAIRENTDEQCKKYPRLNQQDIPEEYRVVYFNFLHFTDGIIPPFADDVTPLPSASLPPKQQAQRPNEQHRNPAIVDSNGKAPAENEDNAATEGSNPKAEKTPLDVEEAALNNMMTEFNESWHRFTESLKQSQASRQAQDLPLIKALSQQLANTNISYQKTSDKHGRECSNLREAEKAIFDAEDSKQECEKALADAQAEETNCRDALQQALKKGAECRKALDYANAVYCGAQRHRNDISVQMAVLYERGTCLNDFQQFLRGYVLEADPKSPEL